MYDTDLPNPYDVPDAAGKIRAALEALPDPPHTYRNRRYWVRVEYYPLVENGEVIRGYES